MNSQQIRHKISKLLTDQQAIALNGFNDTNRSAFDRMQKDVESLEQDFTRVSAMEAREAKNNSFTRSPRHHTIGGGFNGGEETRDRFNRAFAHYARTGQVAEEYRDLLTTSDATGGALVPQMFEGVLHEAQKFYGPVSQKVAQKVTDNNGAPMKMSFSNDVSNGLVLLPTEGTSAPVETEPSFSSKLLGVDTLSGGLVKVSFQELADSSFSLDTLIRDKFAIRYGRGLEKAVTLGVDSAGTALPNQSAGGLLGAATVGTTTTSLAAGIGWNDLIATFSALDPAYSIRPNWLMNSSTRSYLLGLKDGFGRPYFTPDPSGDNPLQKLLGFDIILNQAMPSMSANATPIALGTLDQAYLLRTDGMPSILKLDQRWADTLEVGYLMFTRVGGSSLNAGVSPIVTLKQAAS